MKIEEVARKAKGRHLLVNGKDVGEVIHVYTKSGDYHFLTCNEATTCGPHNTMMYYVPKQMERLLDGNSVTQGHRYHGGWVIRDMGITTYELKGDDK